MGGLNLLTKLLQFTRNKPQISKGQLISTSIGVEDLSSDDIVIVVIGPSGAGRSTFINTAAENELLKVGNGLKPCTTKIAHVRCTIQVDGCSKPVVFVDTPAFPDGDNVGTGLSVDIQNWSNATFGKNITVTGILYLNNIKQNRSTENLLHYHMFQSLCGEGFHTRVLLVTTMWEKLSEKKLIIAERRKVDFENLWSEMIDKGSAVVLHDGSKESAWRTVHLLVGNRA